MLTYTLHDLDQIREAEMSILLQRHGAILAGSDILEIGAGTGRQLSQLSEIARLAVGVDIPTSDYNPDSRFNIVCYDGANLPFKSNSFDVIYSSNAMEHIVNEEQLHREMRRVLRVNGVAIHVVPSSAWRLWTMATYYYALPNLIRNFSRRSSPEEAEPLTAPRVLVAKRTTAGLILDLLCPRRHGEKGTRFSEWWHFRKSSWEKRFKQLGWSVARSEGTGLFYTGYLIGSQLLPIDRRKNLSRLLGSSCFIFVLRPNSPRSSS